MNQVIKRPPMRVLSYSEFGGGKTTFLSTFPKPMLVLFFDPYGKDIPLLRCGTPSGITYAQHGAISIPTQYVIDGAGNIAIQIEYFHDPDPRNPSAYSNFLSHRLPTIYNEASQWATIGLDSMTFMEYAARKWDEYVLNLGHKDGRSHYAQSKNMLEEVFYSGLAALPTNVVVNAHVDEKMSEIHGEVLRSPAAPGTLSKRIGAAFQEVYHLYLYRNEDGTIGRAVQTQSDGQWQALTQIDAPNPSHPDYEALWANFDARSSTR